MYDSFENTVDEGLDPVLEHNNVTAASAQCHDDADPEEVVHQAGEGVEDPAQAAQPAHPHVYPAQAADLWYCSDTTVLDSTYINISAV